MSNTLEASIDINASPQDVWAIVADLQRMGEWSPQCKKMKVIGGTVREGAKTLNINRKGLLVWPTTAKVVRFEPNKSVAFRIAENRTIWSYNIEATETGTKLTERREAPTGTSQVSQFLVKTVFGGNDSFEVELVKGMNATLERVKKEAEAASVLA
ncbi:SRPBCC family protein [Rhodococcus sp. AD45-ID]|uniref:Polyketide cyclase/dehydrase/lipid transport protein n=2 Tax=Nocardiaceae TaxID=85025 RepID=A0A652YW52_NOCGL|nr:MULTISPECIES: SRPBCC family protein [Rhodococcus]NMD59712.1 SRPBCC family protein [Nocardia globerula]KJF23263.1 Polyketide cyclase / dehydrase and lipid transport [Rhodococcus sp. AD45]MDV6268236.1 SRPBCC family protein [Rhodococcus globerulus]PSR41744.1 SRPBCC family protein [Rhodococcus sp. AD45-ID]PVX64202.1 polyketide cyclase/dehydrase/lipid transport protein [Rhodococcus globerulus]